MHVCYSRMLLNLNLFLPCQDLLRNAAKAQLRRMCTLKKTRKDLNVPAWVLEEYKSRPKDELAKILMSCNWDKARSALLRFDH